MPYIVLYRPCECGLPCPATPMRSMASPSAPMATRLATASYDRTAKRVGRRCPARSCSPSSGHTYAVYGVAFSPDGTRLATASCDQTAKVWDAASGREVLTLPATPMRSMAWPSAPMARAWPRPADKTAKVWDVASGRELLTLTGHTACGLWRGLQPRWHAPGHSQLMIRRPRCGTSLRAGGAHPVRPHRCGLWRGLQPRWDTPGHGQHADQTAKVWDVASGREVLTLSGHTDAVYGRGLQPRWDTPGHGQLGSDGQGVGRRVRPGSAHPVRPHRCGLWRGLQPRWDAPGHSQRRSDGQGVGRRSGRELLTLSGHTDAVNGVAFSPDGTRLATASGDQTAKVWDVASGREVLTLTGHTDAVHGVAFSPDGTRLATAS